MKIVIHGTATATADLLRRPVAERPDLLREVYAPLQSMLTTSGINTVNTISTLHQKSP